MKIAIFAYKKETQKSLQIQCSQLGYTDIVLFSSANVLLKSPKLSEIRLLFLHVEKYDGSIIALKNSLEFTYPFLFIVICTGHKEIMQDSFGRNVISFLLEPFNKKDVVQCIQKACFLDREFLPVSISADHSCLCKDILYLQAEQKYTIVYLLDGTAVSSRKPLKDFLTKLESSGFCPVSRSAIINLKYYQREFQKKVYLTNGTSLAVSRRKQGMLKEQLHHYRTTYLHLKNTFLNGADL